MVLLLGTIPDEKLHIGMSSVELTLNPDTQNGRMRHPESSRNLSSVPPGRHYKLHALFMYIHSSPRHPCSPPARETRRSVEV
jgi:hypothetical protein